MSHLLVTFGQVGHPLIEGRLRKCQNNDYEHELFQIPSSTSQTQLFTPQCYCRNSCTSNEDYFVVKCFLYEK